ncbi:MAG: DUF6600 domain-containing protein [Candidatus Acidiferrales bacterium]
MKKFWIFLMAVIFLAAMSASSVNAQDQPAPDPQTPDQSSQDTQAQDSAQQPGVARISQIDGSASTQRGDTGDWVAATVNTPVMTGDRVSTGANSRASVQLDYANILRLASNASAKVATLNRGQIQVQVGQGLATYNVLKGSEAAAEIDTPNVAIRPQGEGEYRILVNNDEETQVIVRRGSAQITTPQGSTNVGEGQAITIAGTDNPQYQVTDAPASDDWDNFNSDRNRSVANASSWHDTDRYYTGSEDLDPYGTWSEVPDYGRVWTPAQAPGWAPYRTGRWVYEPFYGWTWVSYEPWGWAPYHYGRWFVYGGRWSWWPGPVAVYPGYYPVWAPAYVSFFGWGHGGFGFGVGFGGGWGHVGWLPIGPCDWYHPWYGRYGGRYSVVNYTSIHNTTIINNYNGYGPLARGRGHQYSNLAELHNNMRIRSGFSSMDANRFGRGAVPAHQQAFNEANLRGGGMLTGKMPIAPTRAGYMSTTRAANPSTIRNAPAKFFSSSRVNASGSREASRFSSNTSQRSNSFARPANGERSFGAPSNRSAASEPRTNNRAGWNSFGSNRPASTGSSFSRTPSQQSSHLPAPTTRWHTFTPPQSQPGRGMQQPSQNNRSFASPDRGNQRSYTPPSSRPSQSAANNGRAWNSFTPPSRNEQPSRGFSAPNTSTRSFQNNYSRGNNSSKYRPPLNLRQPVMSLRNNYSAPRGNFGGNSYRPPSSNSYRAPSGGGYRAPSGGGYRAPSGGGYRAPSGGSHGGGGGGSHGGGHHR